MSRSQSKYIIIILPSSISFPYPWLVVRDVKWGDEEIKGWMTNPFGVPPPRTLATGRTTRQRSCVQITTFETFLQPGSIDPACLNFYSSHLHPDLPKWLHTKTSRQHLLHPQRQERAMCCVRPPQPLHASSLSQVMLITHALTYPRLLFAFRFE